MADETRKPFQFDNYEDYARKMDAFVYGPTTTYFEQLVADGIALPAPDAINDADIQKKLWEVIARLAERLVFLDHTDHLTDRELYSALWTNHLRGETPVSNDVGFSTTIEIVTTMDDDNGYLFFKHYADDEFRESWREVDPELVMPPHEDPPYNRDYILPRYFAREPEAREWLKANPSRSAFASNRFQDTENAIAFVDQLYAAGAKEILIDNIMLLPPDWLPYADTLYVSLPDDPHARHVVLELIDEAGQPDENDEWKDKAHQPVLRLWWD
jgi:hypothetical protein